VCNKKFLRPLHKPIHVAPSVATTLDRIAKATLYKHMQFVFVEGITGARPTKE
jgi:hypothetical protein